MTSTQEDDENAATATGTSDDVVNNASLSPSSSSFAAVSPSSPMAGLRVETSFGEDEDDDNDEDKKKTAARNVVNGSAEPTTKVKEIIVAENTTEMMLSRSLEEAAAADGDSVVNDSEEKLTRNTQQTSTPSSAATNQNHLSNGGEARSGGGASSAESSSGYAAGAEYLVALSAQQRHPAAAVSSSFRPAAAADDDSNYFMSEPSVSEEESQRVRAPHGLLATGGAFRHFAYSDNEDGDAAAGHAVLGEGGGAAALFRQQQQPHRRSFQQSPIPPSSPGNTSISSWDISPARHKVFFQFGPPSRTNSNHSFSSSPQNSHDGGGAAAAAAGGALERHFPQQQQQQQQPAVIMEKGPNGQRQIRINNLQQQQPQPNQLFPDNMAPPLTFDCIDSPSQPQQRKTASSSAGPTVSSLSSTSLQPYPRRMAPLIQAMSSSSPSRQHQQLKRQTSSSEDDSVLYEGRGGSGSEVERMLLQKPPAIRKEKSQRPSGTPNHDSTPSDAQSLVMTFSDSDEDDNDNKDQEAVSVPLKSNILSTNQHTNDSNNDIIEYQPLGQAQQHTATEDEGQLPASSISSLSLLPSLQDQFRGGRRRPRPPPTSSNSQPSSAPTTSDSTATAPAERPPRAGVYRTGSVSSSNSASAAAANAAAAPASAGKRDTKIKHHRRSRSTGSDGGMRVTVRKNANTNNANDAVAGGKSADSSSSATAAAASAAVNGSSNATSGNSSGGSGGSSRGGNKILRHRRSRSGDAAAASLMGCSDWKGMESLMGTASDSSGVGASGNGDRPPRGSRNKQGNNKDGSSTGGGGGKLRHRRSRSGDAAAASLMAGGHGWKGMEMDNIPLPSVCSSGSHEDDDESEGLRAIISDNTQQKQQQTSINSAGAASDDVRSMGSEKKRTATPPPPQSAQRPPKPMAPPHVTDSPKQAQPVVSMQGEGTGLLPGGQQDFSRASMVGAGYGSMPSVNEQQHPHHPPQQQHAQQQYFAGPRAQPSPMDEVQSFQGGPSDQHRMSWLPSPPPPPPRHLPQQQFLAHIRNSHLGDAWTYTSADDNAAGSIPDQVDYEYGEESDEDTAGSDRPFPVQENRLDNMIRDSRGMQLAQIEQRYEDRKARGSYQAVMRPHNKRLSDSPFANIGKTSTGKAKRSAFLPQTILTEEETKQLPTYICPRCKTRQRAFFSVSDAPKQIEGPGRYLALYFAIYVIASLFIFGLEEGWKPLDCVYFAVITLTTAGLGDFVPTTDANKIICSIFIYFGVACIGLLLGTYIAGMLDDRAFRDAKQKQIQSCPNCARIQTIKENAARRPQSEVLEVDHLETSLGTPLLRKKSPRQMSERIGIERINFDDHSAVYSPRHHHHHHHHGEDQSQPSYQQQRRRSSPQFSGGGSVSSLQRKQVEMAHSPATTGSTQHQQQTINPMPPPPPSISTYQPRTPTQNKAKQSAILGSPMTRQILARQKHSRHESLDISNKSLLGLQSVRKYSADIPSFNTPPTISEGMPLVEQTEAAPSLPFVGRNDQDRNYSQRCSGNDDEDSSDDDDDESSCSGSSSSDLSTVDEITDERISRIKTAKWVFLTLRQALVNSLVIIAVGCVGFWLIEGFSLVDSWYFTTVLLTTVGYGDITPITRGGKLFATTYILVAGTVLLNNMSLISMIPLELRKRRIERAVLTQFGEHLDDAALRELATGPVIQRLSLSAQRADGLDECTREMFALAMLVRLGKVTEQDIKETFAVFRRLDMNDEGVLNSKSIIAGMIAKRRNLSVGHSLNTMRDSRQPPPPPLTPMNPQTAFQNNQQQQVYWNDMSTAGAGTGPPLAETLPPFHYHNQDPEAGMGRDSHDFSLGGAYWMHNDDDDDDDDSSSFESSESSSPSQQEDQLLQQQGHALRTVTESRPY